MQADAELRASWRARWLAAIREIADLGEQRGAWLNPDADNSHHSFVECMCCYFDDLSLDGEDSYRIRLEEGLLTINEVAAVSPLHAMLLAYSAPAGDDYDHEAILSDPAWWAVAAEAKRTIERLRDLLREPEEVRTLLRPSVEGLRARQNQGTA
ncbi:hypothetical protein [Phenylobacterium soli]|uniref:Uncharacterized protein n=1 Tax=Phenylobacterium soli TaxID=2170551 RepID=A0A328AG28_9CAUL|nr:hypothetical protein [Phenylobacterium soli]RAK51768.1 hypothetical protein DJ017_18235 [Phenylobacterium soli]